MILDTNAVSALFSDHNPLIKILAGTRQLHLPGIVIGEFRFGLQASIIKKKMEQKLNVLEAESLILDVTSTTARHYADIYTQLRKIGRPIPQNDIWIAALARQHSLELLSRDRHFEVVRGLRRIGW